MNFVLVEKAKDIRVYDVHYYGSLLHVSGVHLHPSDCVEVKKVCSFIQYGKLVLHSQVCFFVNGLISERIY